MAFTELSPPLLSYVVKCELMLIDLELGSISFCDANCCLYFKSSITLSRIYQSARHWIPGDLNLHQNPLGGSDISQLANLRVLKKNIFLIDYQKSCWMTLRTGEDTLIWRRRLWIALCGGIVLEEALDLSSDRLLNDDYSTESFSVISEHSKDKYFNIRSCFR